MLFFLKYGENASEHKCQNKKKNLVSLVFRRPWVKKVFIQLFKLL